jgi:uracil-DNA glycosylase
MMQDELIQKMLFGHGCPLVPLTVKPGIKRNFVWVSGHALQLGFGGNADVLSYGPRRRYTAAIVGQSLGTVEARRRVLFSGKTGQMLRGWLEGMGLIAPEDVYLASILKTQALEPKKFLVGWVNQQRAITMIELLAARPTYVLALGADTMKFFFGKRKAKLQGAEGRWAQIVWDLRAGEDEDKTDENQYTFYVMPCTNPAALEYEQRQEDIERIQGVVKSFVDTVNNATAGTANADTLALILGGGVAQTLVSTTRLEVDTYRVIEDVRELEEAFAEVGANAAMRLVGVDAEWQGSHPQNSNARLRCIQFAWQPGKAIVLKIHDSVGNPGLIGLDGQLGRHAWLEAFEIIRRAFATHRLRVAGFFYGADHEWLAYYGLDLMEFYEAASSPEACREEGGFAVELALAAVDELSKNNLETVRWRYTQVGDYFGPFNQYKEAATLKASKAVKSLMSQGYGWIPDDVLFPYAGGDADVTLQGALALMGHLDHDANGRNAWRPYWLALRASPTVAEIMRTGMPFNPRRCAELGINYDKALRRVMRAFRKSVNWPTFNIDNWREICEVMYGQRYSPARDKLTGGRLRLRPPGAKTLCLEPVIDNDQKSPMLWEDVRAAGLEDLRTPSTGAKAMGILRKSELVESRRQSVNGMITVETSPPEALNQLFDAKSIRQVQKNFIGKPMIAEDGSSVWFTQGYGLEVCDDGYLRCFMSQTKETGRWSAAMPNLHNLPKRKENNYKNALKELYLGWLRTCFQAPEGYILVESDYSSAELFMLAIASGDEVLWDHCQRNLLPEEDPYFIDPHAGLCVEGFKLACKPTKTGLKTLGKGYLRDVAKCIAAGELLGTALGWVPVELLAEGVREGEVMPHSGSRGLQSDIGLTPLQAVTYVGERDCVTVELYGGYSITTTPEHRHYVLTERGGVEYLEAKKLRYGDYALVAFESYASKKSPRLPDAVDRLMRELDSMDWYSEEEGLTQDGAVFLGILIGAQRRMLAEAATNRALVTIRDIDVATQQQVVELLNKYLGEHAAAGDAVDPTRIYLHSGMWLQLGKAMQQCGWGEIPNALFLWPHALRAAYAYGFTLAVASGVRQGIGLRLTAESAKAYQRLLQSLGWRVHYKLNQAKQFAWISPYGHAATKFLQACRDGDIDQLGELLQEAETVAYPILPTWIRAVAREHSIRLPTSHGDVPYSEGSQWIEHLLSHLAVKGYRLTVEQREQVQRIKDCIEANLVPVLVERVVPAGSRKVYDFQTNEDRGRVLIVNGVATHNSVIYGWAYGRMAPAIVVGAKEEGISVTLDETQRLLATLAGKYYRAAAYLEAAAARVEYGFLYTPMGRIRRCPHSTDNRKLNGYGREFKNAPIQGGVADVVNTAAYNLREARKQRGMTFHILMQIHDAFMFMVRYAEVYELCNEVIPKAMCKDVPIVPFHLDGSRVETQTPKFMGCGIGLSFRWGEAASKEELESVGVLTEKIERLEL